MIKRLSALQAQLASALEGSSGAKVNLECAGQENRTLAIVDIQAYRHLGCGCWTGIVIVLGDLESTKPSRLRWHEGPPITEATELLRMVSEINDEVGCCGDAGTSSHSYPPIVSVTHEFEDLDFSIVSIEMTREELTLRLVEVK